MLILQATLIIWNICQGMIVRLTISGAGGANLFRSVSVTKAVFAHATFGLLYLNANKSRLDFSFFDVEGNRLYQWQPRSSQKIVIKLSRYPALMDLY